MEVLSGFAHGGVAPSASDMTLSAWVIARNMVLAPSPWGVAQGTHHVTAGAIRP